MSEIPGEEQGEVDSRTFVPVLLALTLFLGYGYFHQGGGWNQNVRFDQSLAWVRDGDLHINGRWVYDLEVGRGGVPSFTSRALPDPIRNFDAHPRGNSLDIAVYRGRVYPNKPPGVSLIAAPALWAVDAVRRATGSSGDTWWSLTLSHYLMTVFSVGLVGALGGPIFYRASRALCPGLSPPCHAAGALACGLGTLLFPYATMLFDHVPTAVCSLLAFGLLVEGCDASGNSRGRFAWAGAAAGAALLFNYTSAILSALFGLYIVSRLGVRASFPKLAAMGVGALPAIALLCGYQWLAFGDPFTMATAYQSGDLNASHARSHEQLFGVFKVPSLRVMGHLLTSEHRGLLVSSPILVLAPAGLWLLARRQRRAREVALLVAALLVFLLMNASLEWWHGGNAWGPRYLIPAIPFLMLAIPPVFARWPRLTGAVALASIAVSFLATATNPQVPTTIVRPFREYVVPMIQGQSMRLRRVVHEGPVSANPHGVYALGPNRFFPPRSPEQRGNSFNLGEQLLGRSAVSLLPIAIIVGGLSLLVLRGRGAYPDPEP